MVYSYLDHISDVYVHICNDTLGGIFEDAALAAFEVMVDTRRVDGKTVKAVELAADDIEQLLYKWVDHLIYLFDAESFAVCRAHVKILEGPSPSLSAEICGEPYDPGRHGHKVAVKAMTYSLMKISKIRGSWECYFVLDI